MWTVHLNQSVKLFVNAHMLALGNALRLLPVFTSNEECHNSRKSLLFKLFIPFSLKMRWLQEQNCVYSRTKIDLECSYCCQLMKALSSPPPSLQYTWHVSRQASRGFVSSCGTTATTSLFLPIMGIQCQTLLFCKNKYKAFLLFPTQRHFRP